MGYSRVAQYRDYMALPPAPDLLDHITWRDAGGYHAVYAKALSPEALEFGCRQQIDAATPLELTQEAVRNRSRINLWTTGQRLAETETPFTTGDPA